jgi:hypothetical protein
MSGNVPFPTSGKRVSDVCWKEPVPVTKDQRFRLLPINNQIAYPFTLKFKTEHLKDDIFVL